MAIDSKEEKSTAKKEEELKKMISELKASLSEKEEKAKGLKNEALKDQYEQIKRELSYTSDSISSMAQKASQQSEFRQRIQERLNNAKTKLKEEEGVRSILDSQIKELRQMIATTSPNETTKRDFDVRLLAIEKIFLENKLKNEDYKERLDKDVAADRVGEWSIAATSFEQEKERLKKEETRLLSDSPLPSPNTKSIAQKI